MLLRFKALNASPVITKSIFSRIWKPFSNRKSTFAVRGIWYEFGGMFGKRLMLVPDPPIPEETGAKHPAVPLLQDLPLASNAGAVPETSALYGAPDEMPIRGEIVNPLRSSFSATWFPL